MSHNKQQQPLPLPQPQQAGKNAWLSGANTNVDQVKRVGILWFRNDLRVTDNATLAHAVELVKRGKLDAILPLYVFDCEMLDGVSRLLALPRCGPLRRNFMIESVEDLQANMRAKLDSDLLVSYGNPVQEIVALVDEINGSGSGSKRATARVELVLACKEIAWEELEQERQLEAMLAARRARLFFTWDTTMVHIDDLPYQHVEQAPDVITNRHAFHQFRAHLELSVESTYDVRSSHFIAPGTRLPTYRDVLAWSVPDRMPPRAHIAVPKDQAQAMAKRSAIHNMRGGETEALRRVAHYFFQTDGLATRARRHGLVGTDHSSKLSMWLANGCVSARYLYWKVKELEARHGESESTRKFLRLLLWRDFFKFSAIKHGRRLFYLNGYMPLTAKAAAGYDVKWSTDRAVFDKWCRGETGYPLVDANMRELNETGWMSNRGRQNVASFLALDLGIDWRYGAEYFETLLMDYDTPSNWGCWQVMVQSEWYFYAIRQGNKYDENGEYVRMWLPELRNVPTPYIHCPFRMSLVEQRRVKCVIDKDYAGPLAKQRTDRKPTGRKKLNEWDIAVGPNESSTALSRAIYLREFF